MKCNESKLNFVAASSLIFMKIFIRMSILKHASYFHRIGRRSPIIYYYVLSGTACIIAGSLPQRTGKQIFADLGSQIVAPSLPVLFFRNPHRISLFQRFQLGKFRNYFSKSCISSFNNLPVILK